jgi:hypothetical protein
MESRGIRIDVDVFTSRCGRDGSLVKRDLVTGRLTRFERIRQESGLIEGKVTTAKSLTWIRTWMLKRQKQEANLASSSVSS